MGPETEEKDKQVNLFMKKSDGSYIYMGPVQDIKTITEVPIPTVTNEKETEDYISKTEFTPNKDKFDIYNYLHEISLTMHAYKRSIFSYYDFLPKKIIQNGPAFIVIWYDGTKTVLKKKDGDQDDRYAAFSQALMIKIFGNNRRSHTIVDSVYEMFQKKE